MRIDELRPISVEIAAPQALVFEMAAATGGLLPGSPPHSAEVLERDGDTLLVRYRTPAVITELVMLERVRLYPPDRIEYEVLEGPMEHAHETLAFELAEPHRTVVRYGGTVGSDRPMVGSLIARWIAVPAYDRFMRRQLRALRIAAEARAVRSRRYRRPDAVAYARLGIAVCDAFIACWRVKYTHNLVRPISYIRDVIDPTWGDPLPVSTPPFPEYTSGHSVQSAAAAEVLSATLGDSAFTDHTHDNRGFAPRAFASFAAFAEEAAISRLYGGIHFRSAIDRGLEHGRCVGAMVAALPMRR